MVPPLGDDSFDFLLAYYAGIADSRVGLVVPIVQSSPLLDLAASAVFIDDVERVTVRLVVAVCIVMVSAIGVTVGGI